MPPRRRARTWRWWRWCTATRSPGRCYWTAGCHAGLRPARGRLSLVFANLDAYARFDPEDPTASRFLDEDMNRLWEPEVLGGGRRSSELRRARALLPVLERADVVLDLHSLLWPSDPLILCGRPPRAAGLALALGTPPLVVADAATPAGRG